MEEVPQDIRATCGYHESRGGIPNPLGYSVVTGSRKSSQIALTEEAYEGYPTVGLGLVYRSLGLGAQVVITSTAVMNAIQRAAVNMTTCNVESFVWRVADIR